MGDMALPPGFRFHPTDEELVGYYLKRKVEGLKIELEVIPVVDLYKYDPWELPDKSFQPKRDMEWYFFCPRDKKYPNGSRTNRATAAGYWKATGKDRKVICQSSATGLRKTLVFYRGRAPAGDRTDWVMHEYRLCEQLPNGSFSFQGAFALCRIVKKNEQGQKALDYHGDHHKGEKISLSPSPSMGQPASNEASNMVFSVNQDHSPFPVNNLINGSYESTPICSPSDFRREIDLEPVLSDGNGDVTSYMFQFPTLDTSKEYVKNGESEAENQDINELQCAKNSLQQFPDPFMYTSSSYLYPENELSQMDSMEATNFYDSFPSLDRMGSPYTNTLTDCFELSQTPPICRQSSGDGNLADFSNLWFHEDNSMVMI